MTGYLKLRKLFAIYVEVTYKLGTYPLVAIETCNGEIVFDMPYIQVIFTPGSKLRKESERLNENGNKRVFNTNKRNTENRS